MKIERNENGLVSDGNITFKVPKDRSMFSVMGFNNIYDGDEFRDDFYVYRDGVRIRKWFSKCDGITYWEPKLEDIKTLEYKKHKIEQYVKDYSNVFWRSSFDMLVKVGGGHCKPTHRFEPYKNFTHWYYRINEYDGTKGVGFDWVEKPKKPRNVKIATNYYNTDRRYLELCRRKNKFVVIFNLAIEKYLRENYPVDVKNIGEILTLNINYRSYWYVCEANHYGAKWILSSTSGIKEVNF